MSIHPCFLFLFFFFENFLLLLYIIFIKMVDFRIFTPPKFQFPTDVLWTFFYETGHIPDTKTVGNISQGINYGSMVIFG